MVKILTLLELVIHDLLQLCDKSLDNKQILHFYEAFRVGKHHWEFFPSSFIKTSGSLVLVHTNL